MSHFVVLFSPDDDSEPILGEWLECTLSPEEPTEPVPTSPVPPRMEVQGENKRSRQPSTNDLPNLVPDKREPDGVSSVCLHAFNLYDNL